MRRIYYTICAAALFVMATGCAASRVEMDYGTSQKLAIANQTLNPEAAKNLEPVAGIDGPTAQNIYEGYVKGFDKREQKQETRPTYILGVGAQGSK